MSASAAYFRLLECAATAAEHSRTLEEAARLVLPEVSALTGWPAGRVAEADEATDAWGHRFPVLLGDEVVGWLVFPADDPAPPSEEIAGLLRQVGSQLGRVVERARAERRYSSLAGSVLDGVLTTDRRGTITTANAAAERILGYGPGQMTGEAVSAVLPGISLDGAAEAPAELGAVRADGAEVTVQVSRAEGPAFILRAAAITPRDQLHDPLTGLANRLLLRDRLDHARARSGRGGSSVAVIAVDLDRFKVVNDSYGPGAGDALLVAVAGRLSAVIRSGDTVGRVGGDQFAIVCEDIAGVIEAMTLGASLLDAFVEPFAVEGRDLAVTPRVGIAIAPADGAEAAQLIRDAEVARERARQRGPGQIAIFDESMRSDSTRRLSVEHDLRAGINDGQLRLLYQPIVDLDAGVVVGVEALVRWEHPTRGLLQPLDFIAVAEDSGLIVPLGRWVLEQACRQGAQWQNGRGISGMRVSVNVSARQFRQEHWADEVAQVLSASGFEPARLVLEITESMLMEDIDTTSVRLAELHKLGVRIAIDDFGTGYSSLGYLRHLPVDILKVDKTFIDGVAEGPHESALARAVIKLAATLNLDAVAEGVHSHRQYAQLRRLQCRFAQGYFFSPPLPPDGVGSVIIQTEQSLEE